MSTIYCQVNYQVHRKEKFEQFLDSYALAIDQPLLALSIQRYEKLKGQWQAIFQLEVSQGSNAERVYEQLLLANVLTGASDGNWTVLGPSFEDDLRFECIFNNASSDQPLKWAHFSS